MNEVAPLPTGEVSKVSSKMEEFYKALIRLEGVENRLINFINRINNQSTDKVKGEIENKESFVDFLNNFPDELLRSASRINDHISYLEDTIN